nr:MAG TPA: hypothetical protein [Caudoviricetes sp.]
MRLLALLIIRRAWWDGKENNYRSRQKIRGGAGYGCK